MIEKQALCLSEKRPNAEYLRQSHEYISQASPTEAQSRLHSQRSSGIANAKSGLLQMSPKEVTDSALAYGQASTRKQNEFEKVTGGIGVLAINSDQAAVIGQEHVQ